MILIPAIVAAAFGAAIAGDRNSGLARLLKMAAASAVLFLVFALSPEPSTYLYLIVAALAASWVGDLALTFVGRTPFVIGLVAFATAHVVYTVAFVSRSPLDPVWLTVAGLAMTGFAVVVLTWLKPHRPGELRIPIVIYVVLISVMVTVAFGAHGNTPDLRIPIGAVAFAASDLFVARQRFVTESPLNRIIGLPLYFAAQILFATST